MNFEAALNQLKIAVELIDTNVWKSQARDFEENDDPIDAFSQDLADSFQALISNSLRLPTEGWICTDPDADQWRKVSGSDETYKTTFTFRQGDVEATVSLEDYSGDDIENILSSYGYRRVSIVGYRDALGEVVENCIIAECIFEEKFLG